MYYDKGHWSMRNCVLGFIPLCNYDLHDYANEPIAPSLTVNGDLAPVAGDYGLVYEFDGTGDYIDCGAELFQGFTEITVEAIIKVDSTGTYTIIRNSDSWTKNSFYFNIQSGTSLEMLVYNAGYDKCFSDNVLSAGNWYHVFSTWKAGELIEIYIDGADASDSRAGSIRSSSMMDGDYNAYIGAGPNGLSEPFDGQMALLRIHDRKFSPNEIKELVRDPWMAWRQDDIDVFAVASQGAGSTFNPAWALNSNQIL